MRVCVHALACYSVAAPAEPEHLDLRRCLGGLHPLPLDQDDAVVMNLKIRQKFSTAAAGNYILTHRTEPKSFYL